MEDRDLRLEELVHRNAQAISNYLRRRLHPLPQADLDDLVADTFLVAWRRLEDVPDDEFELPWLLGVARNIAHNAHRSLRRREDHLGRLRGRGTAPSAEDEAVADVAARAAVQRLTPAEREILSLRLWDGLNAEEIAIVLGLTPSAAATRLFRARTRFRSLLTEVPPSRTEERTPDITG